MRALQHVGHGQPPQVREVWEVPAIDDRRHARRLRGRAVVVP